LYYNTSCGVRSLRAQAVVIDFSPTLLKGMISLQGIPTGNDYDL
jgi:hypothetical protein